jgi:hypothetical protein
MFISEAPERVKRYFLARVAAANPVVWKRQGLRARMNYFAVLSYAPRVPSNS